MAAFMDLRVAGLSDFGSKENLRDVFIMAAKLGYETVGVEYFIEDMSVKTSKKGKAKPQEIPTPQQILLPQSAIDGICTSQGKQIKQVSRFSMVLYEAAQVVRLQKEQNIQAYDILSVQPVTDKLFHLACKELDIDIISLNLGEKLPFFTKRQQIGSAIERGIHFEISYRPMIRDNATRRNIISNANRLISVCKGKNIIISSHAQKSLDLRGPYDICNLGLLFDLKESQAKEAVSTNCRTVLLHSKARKSQKGIINVVKVSDMPDKDLWKVAEVEIDESEEDESSESSEDADKIGEPAPKKIKHNDDSSAT